MTSPDRSTSPGPRTVRVALGEKAYDVLIGREVLGGIAKLLGQHRLTAPFVLIHDSHLRSWARQLQPLFTDVSLLEMPAGEQFKSILQYNRLLRALAGERVPRSGTVIALGGGVVGDLAGFVAATYLRGVAFVQIPTTLLAMVDSSVGGKTGVNLREGKNLVGAFHQPRLVVADLDTLATLPPREFAAGMAEVVKYGCIADRALFDRVATGVKPTDPDLADIVARCVEIKARIVEQDEFETTGLRALLNFGHTIGHAIEKATGYKRYLHGEAISLGMRAAAWLSVRHAGLPEADARRIEDALTANRLPLQLHPAVKRDEIRAALGNDKKVAADGLNRWVLLSELGKAKSGFQITPDVVKQAVALLRQPPDRATIEEDNVDE